MANPQPPALAAPNTDAGAMQRLFLLEAVTPGQAGYVAADNLPAMRLMRQTIANRLKSPAEYAAKGATTATDIIDLGNQFAGFAAYPTLDARLQHTLLQILSLAADNPAYAKFVQDAVTSATEPLTPPVARFADVTGWRTAGSTSPGPRFRYLITLSGNDFYATNPVPPLPPHQIRHRASRRHPSP